MDVIEKLEERIRENTELFAKDNLEIKGNITKTGVYLFDEVKMNFIPESFNNIIKHSNWYKRTQKKLEKYPKILEMQSSKSSDALLMNIFCYPDFINWEKPKKLLQINNYNCMKFGWNPEFSYEKKKFEYLKKLGKENEFHPSEIDLKIGDSIFEAKLTEKNFGEKEIEIIQKYDGFELVFDETILKKTDNKYINYQLIRNILVAQKYNYKFILLVDETRNDLIEYFETTKEAVKNSKLKERIYYKTWQCIIKECEDKLSNYISKRYF